RHLVNALLHAAATGLLFLLLTAWTTTVWRAAAVAGLFALHPLHVESVAWISERKDLLCAVFGLASLLAWTAWTRTRSRRASALGVVLYACGLMSKPMIVTLPALMLLADLWPLERMAPAPRALPISRLLAEKAPFFLLAAVSSVVTYAVQRFGG